MFWFEWLHFLYTDRSMSLEGKFQTWVGGQGAKGPLRELRSWLEAHGIEFSFQDNGFDQGSLDWNYP